MNDRDRSGRESAAGPRRLQPGDRIGPYRVESTLGRGGMDEVVSAYDERLDRRVAIKRIRHDASADRGAADRERLRREARAAAALSHPAIVQIHDILSEGDDDAIVMELVEGRSLAECLEDGPLRVPEALRLARQVAEGLAEAHDVGLVHRDLKAENVMVTLPRGDHPGRAKILDFGLAKQLSRNELDETLTQKGAILGTLRAMAPEQAEGAEIDHRSDLFSLGVLLYEMLTGHSPFRGANALETLGRLATETPRPARALNPTVPTELDSLIARLLEKQPERRPGDADEVARALKELATASPGRGAAPRLDDSDSLSDAPTAELVSAEPSPYPGLAPFARQQANVFFGRQQEVEAVWAKLEQRKLLAIIGPSGAGKSSFVRAGVLAALPTGWRCALFHPGAEPLVALGEALAPELSGDPEALRQLVRFEQSGVALSTVASWREKHPEVLLVIDQF